MKKLCERDYIQLYNLIEELQKNEEQIIIAIDGNCTSGKTTFADFLMRKYDANIFHVDDFFRSNKDGFSDQIYANNIDIKRLLDQIIYPLRNNNDIKYQSFDCRNQKLSEDIIVNKKQINIIEGAYSMHPDLISNYQIKIFLKSHIFQQIRRILKRNGLKKLMMFLKVWIPKENAYFKHYKIQDAADFVFKSKH